MQLYWPNFSAVAVISAATAGAAWVSAASPVALCELCVCYVAVLVAALFDADTREIPNAIPLALIVARLCCFLYEYFFAAEATGYLLSSLMGAFFCFLVFAIASKVARGGIGGGDIKLASAMGFMCGLYFILYTLAFALVLCGIVAAALVVLKKRGRSDGLPFAPFLYVGFVASVFASLL